MMRLSLPLCLLTLMLLPALAQADGTPSTANVDRSKTFYTRQAPDGSTVLGNGEAEGGAVPMQLQAPAVVGGTNLNARGVRPGAEGVAAAVNGVAPTTNYTSNAVRDDLKAKDEKIATRVSQMFHRNHGLKDPAAATPVNSSR